MSANNNDSMLVIFDLYVLDKIYNSVKDIIKLDYKSKMVYQSCLTYYFKDRPLKLNNNISFRITYDLAKFDKFKNEYHNLNTAGIIAYEKETISFPAVIWFPFINQDLFKSDRIELINKIDAYEKDILNNQSFLEIVSMKNQLQMKQVKELCTLFIAEQKAVGVIYNTSQEAKKHFSNWIRYNKDQSSNIKAKSNSQIIGYESNKPKND